MPDLVIRSPRAITFSVLAALLSACAEDPEPTDSAPVAPLLQVQPGTGPRGTFVPFAPGDLLRLQRGCQGAQHIFTGVRVRGARPALLRITVHIVRTEDGQEVSAPLDIALQPELDPEVVGALRVTGLTPVIEVPREILGREAELRVSVTQAAALATNPPRSSSGTLRGVVQWGLDSCETWL